MTSNRKRKRAMMRGERGKRRRFASFVQSEANRFPIRPLFYRLTRRKRIIPVEDPLSDAALMQFGEVLGRTVGLDVVGDLDVSTVFLCTPHGIFRRDFFETAIINEGRFDIVRRYPTWNEAKAGHAEVVKALREGRDYDSHD
jgi:hypothetical protein